MTFREAKDALLDLVRRPKSQAVGSAGSTDTMDTVAGRQINAAILWANRTHNFQYAEKTFEYTFPADQLTVSRTLIDSGNIIGLKTVQRLSESGKLSGRPYKILSYTRLQSLRDQWLDKTSSVPVPTTGVDLTTEFTAHELVVNQQFEYYVFRLNDGFGLYPTPITPVTLLLHYNSKLPELVADGDTNFLLEFAWDFIYSKALKRFNIYLKDDARVSINNDQITEEWQSVVDWDTEIKNAQSIEFDSEL